MSAEINKLDNPAWHALSEVHAEFAIGNDEIKRYRPDICAFAAYLPGLKEIPDQLIQTGESFFIIGDLPYLSSDYVIENTLPCLQMICSSEIKKPLSVPIEKLTVADEEEMTSLVNLVQPGYYKPGTRLMGDYFGIRQNGQLVAITGERMRMNGLTEISAVVTHPDFTGRSYAQQLVTYVSNKNFLSDIIPFLHVAQSNTRAISIYEHLGFAKRRVINFTRIRKMRDHR